MDALVARLQEPALRVVQAAWEAAKAGERSEGRRRQLELQRAKLAADDARRRAYSVDPENHLAKAEYDKDWHMHLANIQRLENLGTVEPSLITRFTKEKFAELQRLFGDLRALWNAPTTAMIERKQLIRTMIEAVVVEERTTEHFIVRLVWADPAPDTVIEVKRFAYYRRLIVEGVDEGLTLQQIATRLNDMSLRTRLGRQWSRDTLYRVVKNAGVHDKVARCRRAPKRD